MNDPEGPMGWPPADESARFRAPLFPLSNVLLYPGQGFPLHLFEPRYLKMFEDIVDTHGRVVIAPILEGKAGDSHPAVHQLAGVGEVTKYTKLPDGRVNITLVGLGRVKITEVECDTPYRQVDAEPFSEIPASDAERPELLDDLKSAISERFEASDQIAQQSDVRMLADMLAFASPLPFDELTAIYSEPHIGIRARRLLTAHHREFGDGGEHG